MPDKVNPRREQYEAAVADLLGQCTANGHNMLFVGYNANHANYMCKDCQAVGMVHIQPAEICESSTAPVVPCYVGKRPPNDRADTSFGEFLRKIGAI